MVVLQRSLACFFFFFETGAVTVAASVEGVDSLLPAGSLGYVSSYRIVERYPHSETSFTQGLAFDDYGNMYESDGMYRRSRVRRVNIATGKNVAVAHNDPKHFGEGLTIVGNKTAVQLTWRERALIEYEIPSLRKIRTIEQPVKEGWGIAAEGELLYIVDGSATLRSFAAGTYAELGSAKVRDPKLDNAPIEGLNELEMVHGELWANVYPMHHHRASQCIARINPIDATVIGWVDLNGLFDLERAEVRRRPHDFVLNGIAFHKLDNSLYVTGKNWGYMYKIELVHTHHGVDHVRRHCNLWLP